MGLYRDYARCRANERTPGAPAAPNDIGNVAVVTAEMTLTTPKFTTSVNAALSSSSRIPNEPPMDMLITSTALFKVPELVGPRAKSIPSRIATPLQLLDQSCKP